MYPLDQGLWGATARITHLRSALGNLAELEVVAGDRAQRRARLTRYAWSGRLRGLDGIYVENSSTLPSETDIAFLALARALGIPVLTYVRDAQYLFEEYYAATTLKRRLARDLFLPAIRLLRRVSSRTAYPSRGLAAAVRDPLPEPLLLPPGSPPPVFVPRNHDARSLLFVGAMRYAAHGLSLLVSSIERVRAAGSDLRLIVVSRQGEEPPQPRPGWMHVVRGSGTEIHALLPEVLATIQPRLRSPYNDLAVPIKVMDYLSYGRPLVVTDCTEQARIVRGADAGIVVKDTVDDMTAGLERLLRAEAAELDRWSTNAIAAAERSSWTERATQVVGVLEQESR
ncbi:MAG: glycosyltransferase family 4 protein [Chloroflexota bacterium]|nr:glycosyltransferase family 4 protein [Chloroflexota bacterium]